MHNFYVVCNCAIVYHHENKFMLNVINVTAVLTLLVHDTLMFM
jgi:hypothetical protein